MSMYSFFADTSFIDPTDFTVNLEQLDIPGGFLDREMIEYFVEPVRLVDTRAERLTINFRPSSYQPLDETILIEDALGNITSAGEARMALYPANTVTVAQYTELDYTMFENETMPANPVAIDTPNSLTITLDATKLTTNEATAFEALDATDIDRIYNIAEYLFYGTIPADTLDQVDTVLLNDPLFSNYVATTVRMSQLHVAVGIFGGIDIHRFSPTWVEFSYNKGGEILTFTVWIGRNSFILGYPLFTVQDIVPPLALNLLVDPSTITDPIEAAALSRAQIDDVAVPRILVDDQTSMSFTTRYIWGGTTHHLSFTILYRGRPLSPMEARIVIKDYLIASGVTTEALWGVRFPDIFIDNTKWIIPIFDNTTNLLTGSIYPSVSDLQTVIDKLAYLGGLIDIAVPETQEVITAAYANFLIGVFSSDTDIINSFYEMHPTYTDASTTDISFTEMEQVTQDMSQILNNILAVADGQINNVSFSTVELYGMQWVMFIHDGNSYLVLDKTSYLTMLAGM